MRHICVAVYTYPSTCNSSSRGYADALNKPSTSMQHSSLTSQAKGPMQKQATLYNWCLRQVIAVRMLYYTRKKLKLQNFRSRNCKKVFQLQNPANHCHWSALTPNIDSKLQFRTNNCYSNSSKNDKNCN
eukprot:2811726-Amphidinium_carterae.1